MKSILFLVSFLLGSSARALPPHFDLDVSSAEYRSYLKKIPNYKNAQSEDPHIANALMLGDRLSQWIRVINESRTFSSAIRLTSPSTRRSAPIERPNAYSPKTIQNETHIILSGLPPIMKDVLINGTPFPANLNISDDQFIFHARKLDKNYQDAARYRLLIPHRDHYIAAQARDVRGYYFLRKNNITEESLLEVSRIPSGSIPPLREALLKLCLNANVQYSKCEKALKTAFSENSLAKFYQLYFPHAERNWNSFFEIPKYARRFDLQWSGSSAIVPFNFPEHERFIPYLRDNIQDEFRWKGWGLQIRFGHFPEGPRLKFVPGVVPYVNELGGNEIVMDANQPIEEYESQWTIRHEFGHVLGLPDCYHEFYDNHQRVFVNYQLDVTDLMCSRAGNMNERIFKELQRAYQK